MTKSAQNRHRAERIKAKRLKQLKGTLSVEHPNFLVKTHPMSACCPGCWVCGKGWHKYMKIKRKRLENRQLCSTLIDLI